MSKEYNGRDDYTNGGAWGLKLFQSDHDYGIIVDLTHEAGLFRYEAKARHRAEDLKGAKPPTFRSDACGIEADARDTVSYLIYSKLCSNVTRVRKHLDKGALDRLLKKYHATYVADRKQDTQSGKPIPEYYQSGYVYVLIGACAMSLGCKLADNKATLRREYPSVGLMRDALIQMEAATHPETGYKDGSPWNFDSLGLEETKRLGKIAQQADRLAEHHINVQPPGNNPPMNKDFLDKMFAHTQKSFTSASKEQLQCWAAQYPSMCCGGCGKRENNGVDPITLKVCQRCNQQKYCSRKCQKLHWGIHKVTCRSKEELFLERLTKMAEKARENRWHVDDDDEQFIIKHFSTGMEGKEKAERQIFALLLRDMLVENFLGRSDQEKKGSSNAAKKNKENASALATTAPKDESSGGVDEVMQSMKPLSIKNEGQMDLDE